ncbi:hypothetical protein R6Z07F_008522 [Ovis aries]
MDSGKARTPNADLAPGEARPSGQSLQAGSPPLRSSDPRLGPQEPDVGPDGKYPPRTRKGRQRVDAARAETERRGDRGRSRPKYLFRRGHVITSCLIVEVLETPVSKVLGKSTRIYTLSR